MKTLFALLFLACHTSALIEWRFEKPKDQMGGTHLIMGIGTPVQQVNATFIINNNCPGISIYRSKTTGFEPRDSSTFHEVGDYTRGWHTEGINGTDDFVIQTYDGQNQTYKQQPFVVIDRESYCQYKNWMSLTYSDDDNPNDFLDSMLENEENKTLVFTYDTIPQYWNSPFSGKLTLGGQPEHCSTNWNRSPTMKPAGDRRQWNIQLEKVSAGKYAAFQPGTLLLNLYYPGFLLTYATYSRLVAELGSNFDGDMVLCNSTVNLTFTVNGYDLQITPDDYMDKTRPNDYGYCPFLADIGRFDEHEFTWPAQIYKRYCLMLDLESKELGLAKRLK